MKLIDISGQRFGRWTVSHRDLNKSKNYWFCRCDCGVTKSICASTLRRGHSKSCGCLMKELVSKRRRSPLGPANRIYREYIRNAEKANRAFTLSLVEFEKIISSPCHYCNAAPSGWATDNRYTPAFGGVDRVDNDRGYVPDNVVPACGICNQMKHMSTQKEFAEKIVEVYNFWARHNG